MSLLQATGVEGVFLLDAAPAFVPAYTGVYLIRTREPAIVETGFSYSVPRVLEGLDELGIAPERVRYLLPTHVHLDHAGGAGGLAQACPQAQVIVHERGAKHLVDPAHLVESVRRAVGKLFERYGEAVPIPSERLVTVTGGERFTLDEGVSLEIIDAPGHAPHQYAVHLPEQRALFTADAAGIYRREVGRLLPTTPPPAFRLGESLETLLALKALEPKTLLYTHYGPYPADDLLDRYADVLTRWVTEIETALDTMREPEAVVTHFLEKLSPAFAGHYDPVMVEQEITMNVQGVLLYLQRQRES